MSNTRKIIIIAFSLILIGGIGAVANLSALEMEPVQASQSVDAAGIDSISVELDNGKVELRETDAADIRVELGGKIRKNSDIRLEVEERDGTLQIRTQEPMKLWFTMFSGLEKLELTVFVPNKLYEAIEVDNSNGKIEVSGVEAKQVRAKLHNGSIHLDRTAAERIDFYLSNGDVELAGVRGDLSGEVLNGQIRVDLEGIQHNMDMTVLNGEIKVTTEQKPTSVIYDLRTTNGEVRVFGSRDWEPVTGDGAYNVKLRTTNGRISIDQK